MNESINKNWEFATNVVKNIYAKLGIPYPKSGFVYDSNVKSYILLNLPNIPYLRRIKTKENENVDLRYFLFCLCHHKMPTITELREIPELKTTINWGFCPICNHKVNREDRTRVYCEYCQVARAYMSRLTYFLRFLDEVGKDLLILLSNQVEEIIEGSIKKLKSYWEQLKPQTAGRYTLKDVISQHVCLKSVVYAIKEKNLTKL